jgi:thymidine kinase
VLNDTKKMSTFQPLVSALTSHQEMVALFDARPLVWILIAAGLASFFFTLLQYVTARLQFSVLHTATSTPVRSSANILDASSLSIASPRSTGLGNGSLTLIMGPMFAQKTSFGILQLRRHRHRQHKCLAIKHAIDTRYTTDKRILSHDGMEFTPSVIRSTLDPHQDAQWAQMIDSFQVVLVEEGHFFNDLKAFCLYAIERHMVVYVSCLNATSEQTMFPSIVDVLPYANDIQYRQSSCTTCNSAAAPLTVCLSKKVSTIQVGGVAMYEPRCMTCWFHDSASCRLTSSASSTERNAPSDSKSNSVQGTASVANAIDLQPKTDD